MILIIDVLGIGWGVEYNGVFIGGYWFIEEK